MKVTTPANSSATESDNLTLASCSLHYFDVLYSRPVQHTVECVIVLNPNITSPVTSDAVDDIELHKLRCEVADALGQASTMADRGNFTGARDMLQRATVRVRGSRVHRQLLAVHLLETLQESLEGIQDKVTYVQHGKSVMQNYAGSHWQQRSNTTPSHQGYVKQKAQLTPAGLLQAKSALHAPPTGAGPPPPPPSVDSYNPYRHKAKMKMMSEYSSAKHGKKK